MWSLQLREGYNIEKYISQNQDYVRQLKQINNYFFPSDSCLTNRWSPFEVSVYEMEVVEMNDARATKKFQTSNSLMT